MGTVHRTSHQVYELMYHLVWCPKYRNPLPPIVQETVGRAIQEASDTYGFHVLELEVMPDHVHVFLEAPPTTSPGRVARILKSLSARTVFDQHPWVCSQFNKALWSPSYYVGSVGHVSEDTVREYVRTQQERA